MTTINKTTVTTPVKSGVVQLLSNLTILILKMMAVTDVYRAVIEEVINNARADFKDEKISEECLMQLQTVLR